MIKDIILHFTLLLWNSYFLRKNLVLFSLLPVILWTRTFFAGGGVGRTLLHIYDICNIPGLYPHISCICPAVTSRNMCRYFLWGKLHLKPTSLHQSHNVSSGIPFMQRHLALEIEFIPWKLEYNVPGNRSYSSRPFITHLQNHSLIYIVLFCSNDLVF